MPIHHAVLALLADGPSHGYGIKGAFEAAIGPQWSPLNIGHLYQVLDRLQRERMVTSTRVPQDVRPDRIVYELTEAGREELTRWLSEPTPRTSGYRDDFFLKVMAAAQSRDPKTVRRVLTTQRAFLLRELRNLETLRTQRADDPVVVLLLAAAARHVGADLSFLDDAEQALLSDNGATLRRIASALPSQAQRDAAAGVSAAGESLPRRPPRRRRGA